MLSDEIRSKLTARIKQGLDQFGQREFQIEVKQVGSRTYQLEILFSKDTMFFLRSEKTTLRDISKIIGELEKQHKIAIEKYIKPLGE
jgi:hypothetical protein